MAELMAPGIEFRIADPSDIDAIVALVQSAYRGQGSAGWTTEAHLLDGQRTDATEVSSLIAAADSQILLAILDGRVAGCCHLQRIDGEVAGFGMFAVDPERQARGIGRALVVESCRRVSAEGARRLRMSVIKQREDLIDWYGRLGFLPTGRTEPFPDADERFGLPRRPDLEFVVLEGPCASQVSG